MLNPHTVLKNTFGYSNFRPGQEKVIDLVLEGQNVLAVMPTGAGKSLCYQVPALVNPRVTLVISPLISLMKDQIDSLHQNGIEAAALNSATPQEEVNPILRQAYEGKIKLLYVTPERLAMDYFRYQLNFLDISLVAVDEAHCISQWGHDFRPAYRQIMAGIKALKSQPNILALTATATPAVQDDIANQLAIPKENRVITSFARPNLSFSVVNSPKDNNLYIYKYIHNHQDEAGIVYTNTRKKVEDLTNYLAKKGISVAAYHGGLPADERAQVQDAFQFDQVQVIVATNAFGMGIDKSNVRFVIHANSARNLESYYQEAGRAGRDGDPCEAVMLYKPGDLRTYRWFIENSDADEKYQKVQYTKLAKITQYANTSECLQQFIVRYFGQDCPPCGKCSNCLDKRELMDITQTAKKVIAVVYELDGRFGKNIVAQVAVGSKNQRMKELDAEQLDHYDSLKMPQNEAISLINYLVANGYLEQVGDQYPVVHVTNKGWDVLDGKQQVFRRQPQEVSQVRQENADNGLFALLKEKRLELAKEQKVPAFMIFNDRSLREMTAELPTTEDEFLEISGVGQAKMERYGKVMMQIIKDFKKNHQG
ncbi:DNA helicase RecQ [Lactobacillus xujianguonis]|uniref:DNA helicase RecQ n=1 Tax=Lactobacillus xujianguonis TaxID=2495899 RepID=UPI000FDAD17B|nr:DNA helicase RecQ [Lactobacillus xujianguonis]RVU77478.1 DNA helicase RecQ [Lactobacillus xujianguonis]